MDKDSKIVIIGAGIFGLSCAYQLASEGYKSVVVVDRHLPPVPDGSSNDISRVVRFDYGDDDYLDVAHKAYLRWQELPRYKDIFSQTPYVLTGNSDVSGQSWILKTTAALTRRNLPWAKLNTAEAARKEYPVLSGALAGPNFFGYHNKQAGWVDAHKAVLQLRDDCFELGVSFICGQAGTVVGFNIDSQNEIKGIRTLAGSVIDGDHFFLMAGAWSSGLVPMYKSTLATAQVVGYVRLTESEMRKYKDLPIYANFSTGWFNFPPHEDTKMLKMAIHGWGYTRAPNTEENSTLLPNDSLPPLKAARQRPNFVPSDGESRLREGLREILPELANRKFEKVAMCWYTDTPTNDFIMDFHPDFKNLFIGGGGSGHAFKFLPVLGEYLSLAIKGSLPPNLASKWKFRTEFKNRNDVFEGDGSRAGPARRELDSIERAKL